MTKCTHLAYDSQTRAVAHSSIVSVNGGEPSASAAALSPTLGVHCSHEEGCAAPPCGRCKTINTCGGD